MRWELRPGAVLLLALLYFFDGTGLLAAAAPAVLVHELGHAAALRLCSARVTGLTLAVSGLRMDYAGALDRRQTLLCVAAGPAAGLVYALAACTLGGAYLKLSGAVSFCLSVFNLLPVLPLDGGRLAAALLGDSFAGRLSRRVSPAVLLAGGALFALWHSLSLLYLGAWLTACAWGVGIPACAKWGAVV